MNSEIDQSETEMSQEGSEEDDDAFQTLYYFEHRTKNLKSKDVENSNLPLSIKKKLVRNIEVANKSYNNDEVNDSDDKIGSDSKNQTQIDQRT